MHSMQRFRTFLGIMAVLGLVLPPPAIAEVVVEGDETFLSILAKVSDYAIAVLPMENLTVEGDIAHHFRQRLMERLRAKGYSVIAGETIDQGLYQLGLSQAEQLRLLPFQDLQKLTSADAFLSGVVTQGAVQHAGVYNAYVYTCSLKLQNRDGEVLWSSLEERVAKRRFAADPVNMFLDIALTEGGGDMRQAVFSLADKMLAKLPNGPVHVLSGADALLDAAVEITAKEQ